MAIKQINEGIFEFFLPGRNVQQSASFQGNSTPQLFFPQINSPIHSESISQSPCPKEQGYSVVQQSAISSSVPELHGSSSGFVSFG